MNNKLVIAAAGSGKTTTLVKEALKQTSGNVLITTYTEANAEEIKRKIIEMNKAIPSHITVQTWFSLLLEHGIKPFQGCLMEKKIQGMILVNTQSGKRGEDKKTGAVYYFGEETDFERHYFTKKFDIYSDKISKLAIRCNEKSDGKVIQRLSRLYTHIYIDEVQDLAGYDLEFIKLLLECPSTILLMGDPRQVTYLTHHDRLHVKYKEGKIKDFLLEKCKKITCEIDETSLNKSHRNNAQICDFASKLYPSFEKSTPCSCVPCRNVTEHEGIFLVRKKNVAAYIVQYQPAVLRYSMASELEWTFGKSKGLGFSRVLIYPTAAMVKYLQDGLLSVVKNGKSENCFPIPKFYVALTRGRYSVGIVTDYKDADTFIEGVQKY